MGKRVLGPIVALACAFPATADAVTMDSAPPAFSNSPNPSFTFTANPSFPTLQCSLDGTPLPGPCTSPRSVSVGEGMHTFAVTGMGPTGLPDPMPASHTWTVDFLPPDTSLTASPPPLTNSTTATFEFTSPDSSASFQCSLNGGAFNPCTSPQVFSGLGDGARNFTVRAVDPATNVDQSPPSVNWTVDATPPDTTITSGPGATTNLKQPTLEFASSEPGSTFQCAVNGGAFAACPSPHVLAALADGAITFQARAVDGAGNIDPTPAPRAWTLDSVPPSKPAVWIGPRPPARVAPKRAQARTFKTTAPFQTTTQLRVEWKGVAGAASYDVEYRLSIPGVPSASGAWTPWKTNVTATQSNAVIDTARTGCFRARSTDAAGNNSDWVTRCTTLPFKATKAFVAPGFTKQTGGGYFAGQFARRTGIGTPGAFLRLQLTPLNAPQFPPQQNGQPVSVKRVILLVTKCPNCGKIRVLVSGDGSPPTVADPVVDKTFDLTAATTKKRRVVSVATFSSASPTFKRRFIWVFAIGPDATRRVEGIGVSSV